MKIGQVVFSSKFKDLKDLVFGKDHLKGGKLLDFDVCEQSSNQLAVVLI